MTAPQPSAVTRHYQQGDLRRKIDEALDRLYPGDTTLTTDDLHGVDEFHTGGHAATRQLAEHLELRAGLRVLDVGSGLGGPARHLAQHSGADVTGVDLTEEYVDVARWLTDRVGLTGRARFQQGDVTALPFPKASFDRAWMLHVGMNIEDKARLFTEISRVLTDMALFLHRLRRHAARRSRPCPLPTAVGLGARTQLPGPPRGVSVAAAQGQLRDRRRARSPLASRPVAS